MLGGGPQTAGWLLADGPAEELDEPAVEAEPWVFDGHLVAVWRHPTKRYARLSFKRRCWSCLGSLLNLIKKQGNHVC